jgi:hypothetical protein
LNQDFRDMLSALSAAGAEFLVVGAHAMAAHGLVRATGDLDIWVRSSDSNATKVWDALRAFRAPLSRLSVHDLTDADVVFQMGVEPNRIDILSSISGVTFDEAWSNRREVDIGGLRVPVIGRRELLLYKRAAGRPKDLADVAWLESGQADGND